jgi:hypothetical protein
MDIQKSLNAFINLGKFLELFCSKEFKQNNIPDFHNKYFLEFEDIIKNVYLVNPWFTEENVRSALYSISNNLSEKKLNEWIHKPEFINVKHQKDKTVAVIMAGNIPLVGFHDFLCVLISGNRFLGKLSSVDNKLLPFISDLLIKTEPEFKDYIRFTDDKLSSFDAIIATGSNNSSRYFHYYFSKYPCIIRKNRNSIAILDESESFHDLLELSKDIFFYFGLGCRNVSKIYVPIDYYFDSLFNATKTFQNIISHTKYNNNYVYNKSIYQINKINYHDNGFAILKEEKSLASPISVTFYEYYKDLNGLAELITSKKDEIQCIISSNNIFKNRISFGNSQFPELWDYADGINTIEFLNNL